MAGLLDSMPGTPSAISQMLGLLMQHPAAGQPGQAPPPPVAPMAPPVMVDPQQQAAPEPPQSLLGRIHDFISDRVGIKEPGGYRGLLSDAEIQHEKPGIITSQPGQWAERLDHMLALKGAMAQAQEHQRVMQSRQNMPQDLSLPDQLKYAVNHGDTELVKLLAEPAGKILSEKTPLPSANIKEVPGVGAVDFTDPAHPRIVMKGESAPRNIDPLSPAGIAAQLKLNAAKAEQKGAGGLAAPMAAKVGQAGEMIKKLSDLMPATDALNVSLSNSSAQDVATHGVGIGGLHVPGTQGVGSMMVNRSPEYATYQAALTPFILAAAHALSGARINDTQVQQIRASVEIKPGESAKARAQKHKNLIDLVNSISGSLPADAIAAQEDQMDPNAIALLKGYGYRGAKRSADQSTPNSRAAAILAKHGIK